MGDEEVQCIKILVKPNFTIQMNTTHLPTPQRSPHSSSQNQALVLELISLRHSLFPPFLIPSCPLFVASLQKARPLPLSRILTTSPLQTHTSYTPVHVESSQSFLF